MCISKFEIATFKTVGKTYRVTENGPNATCLPTIGGGRHNTKLKMDSFQPDY